MLGNILKDNEMLMLSITYVNKMTLVNSFTQQTNHCLLTRNIEVQSNRLVYEIVLYLRSKSKCTARKEGIKSNNI